MSDAQSNITVVLEVMDFIQQMPGVKQNGFLSVKAIVYSTQELGKLMESVIQSLKQT